MKTIIHDAIAIRHHEETNDRFGTYTELNITDINGAEHTITIWHAETDDKDLQMQNDLNEQDTAGKRTEARQLESMADELFPGHESPWKS